MQTALRLNEWLEVNILGVMQPVMSFLHDTEPPVAGTGIKRKKSRHTRTVRRADAELAKRRARFDRETRKHWKPLYPSDS